MAENLFTLMRQHMSIHVEMVAALEQVLTKKHVEAGEYLLRAGQVASFVLFVEQGSFYYYKVDEQGKERVVNFAFEGDIFTDVESYVMEEGSDFYIKTLEPSVIHYLTKRDLEKLLEQDLKWERLVRLILQDAFVRNVQERKDMKTLSNTEHYQKLIETHPNFFQRVPLYLIASYLNITPEGLSKIRRRLSIQ